MPGSEIRITTRRRRFLQNAAMTAFGVSGLNSVFGAAGSPGFWSGLDEKPAADSVFPELQFHPGSSRNAEPDPLKLVADWKTPVSQFFIRSHGANPRIDLSEYRLTIEGLVDRPVHLSLAELTERFGKAGCTCTLTCAGNRRNEFSRIRTVSGVQWRAGAIGNAIWEGVRLSDVLKSVGVKDSAKHVWFDGLDEVKDGDKLFPFGGSIPLSKVFEEDDQTPGALLATHMNGAPLTADHGAPLRTVVPGYVGARSVKWLGKITVSDRHSPNHYVDDVYKILKQDTQTQRDEAAPIYRFPVNSAICSPVNVSADQPALKLTGYALPTGTQRTTIAKVELSSDGGRTWNSATLQGKSQEYCWQLWSGEVPLQKRTSSVQVRATDSSGIQQPETIVWNPKGYLFNAWHSVPLNKS